VAGAGGLARVAADALGERLGLSLPYRPERVTEPATLAGLVQAGAVGDLGGPVCIDAVHRQDVPSVSSNCQNLVLTLEQPAGKAVLPDSVFVKLPMESLATRWFFSVINSWRLESHFFRHVAREIPLRTPVAYATASRGTRFYLVQENLRADPSVELFTNLDMHAGPSLAQVYLCLDAFARLHARYWGLDSRRREAVLPLELHPFLSRSMGPVARNLNRLALGPCMKKHPGVIPGEMAETYRFSMRHWDTLLGHWFDGPLSLLHGDSHLGNFFLSGDEMGMLDWQAAHWGKGTRDVQYFLVDALPADTLARHERELVDYYVERRSAHGAPLHREQAWQEYRSFAFHTLMTIVVSVGFGALNEEQDALMAEILRRAVAAMERLDYAGWLRSHTMV